MKCALQNRDETRPNVSCVFKQYSTSNYQKILGLHCNAESMGSLQGDVSTVMECEDYPLRTGLQRNIYIIQGVVERKRHCNSRVMKQS